MCLSALGASDAALAWFTVEQTLKIVLPVIIALSLVDSMQQLTQIAWVIVLSHGYLALEFNMSYYSGFNRLLQTGFAGMEEKSIALTMVMGAAAAFFLALNAERWWIKARRAGLAVLMMHVPLFTFARSGMLGIPGVGCGGVLAGPKEGRHTLARCSRRRAGLRTGRA